MNVCFTVEFPEPSKEQVLAVACPFCEALPSEKCMTKRWRGGSQRINRIHTFHHDRVAVACGLKIVSSSTIYRL